MSGMQSAAGEISAVQQLIGPPAVGMSHHFAVLIDDVKYHLGDWARVSGLSVSWQQLRHRAGDSRNRTVCLPGATSYEPIMLSRAASVYSRVVQYWLAQTSKNPKPQSGEIQLVDFAGLAIVQWRLEEFFPLAWSVDAFDAAGAKPVIETLTLAHTGFLDDDISMLSPF
jgi:phage tail-like protein